MNPIPWSAIVQYADVHDLAPDVYQVFRVVVREMDAGYLTFHQTEQKRKRDKKRGAEGRDE